MGCKSRFNSTLILESKMLKKYYNEKVDLFTNV